MRLAIIAFTRAGCRHGERIREVMRNRPADGGKLFGQLIGAAQVPGQQRNHKFPLLQPVSPDPSSGAQDCGPWDWL